MDAKFPVTGLGGRKDKLAELVCAGYSDICEVPEDALELDGHKRIHRITRAGEPELLEEAVTLTRALVYPRHCG